MWPRHVHISNSLDYHDVMEVLLRYSGKSDPRTILVLFGILALVFAVFAVWYGVLNLRQAKTISRHFSLRELEDHIGELVTVLRAPEPLA